MNSYRESNFFLENVKKNDVFGIKSSLVDMMQRMKANRIKIEEAIKFAMNNSDFQWEEHDNDETKTEFPTLQRKYGFERERLVQNFSKVRYERVLGLLDEVLKERAKAQSNSNNSSITEENKIKLQTKASSTTDTEKKFQPARPSVYKKKKEISLVMLIAGTIAMLVLALIVKVIL